MAKVGRPTMGQKAESAIVSKLLPYLRAGLSLHKACLEADVNRATVYRIMERNKGFRDKIHRAQQFLSVITANAIAKQVYDIARKQDAGEELSNKDVKFLMWFATNSNLCREEFGKRSNVEIFDPEVEIQRINRLIEERFAEDETGKNGEFKRSPQGTLQETNLEPVTASI